jgi:acrylyl-CoA reductase (NADPH)/3-hydroxypropionyl-CoA dehydratase/3-hydroxypropionyl-CoA synthetase
VIAAPYPYLCRTIWGDAAELPRDGHARGRALARRRRALPFQDLLVALAGQAGLHAGRLRDPKYADGGFSLHGRSDDVINVSGHRLGTEEIEGAILRDKQVYPDSPVGNVIVIGAPHRAEGLTPLAFVKPAPGPPHHAG